MEQTSFINNTNNTMKSNLIMLEAYVWKFSERGHISMYRDGTHPHCSERLVKNTENPISSRKCANRIKMDYNRRKRISLFSVVASG